MSIFKNNNISSYLSINLLGKSVKLNINYINGFDIRMIERKNEFHLYLPKKYRNKNNIEIINYCIKNLYNRVAQTEIENSMELIRHILKFAPEDYLIKRMNNCFYKANNNIIIVNPDIVQYNKDIINITILQAFCKTKYRSNTNKYKDLLEKSNNLYEDYKYNLNNKKDKVS